MYGEFSFGLTSNSGPCASCIERTWCFQATLPIRFVIRSRFFCIESGMHWTLIVSEASGEDDHALIRDFMLAKFLGGISTPAS